MKEKEKTVEAEKIPDTKAHGGKKNYMMEKLRQAHKARACRMSVLRCSKEGMKVNVLSTPGSHLYQRVLEIL